MHFGSRNRVLTSAPVDVLAFLKPVLGPFFLEEKRNQLPRPRQGCARGTESPPGILQMERISGNGTS
ncbi:MAG: hypothetical protein ACFFD4_04290 [Candidatus Odinarchaeota archaeon]